MNIWVDADACPAVIKEILFRAADRVKLSTTLVANQQIRVPPSPYIRNVQVSAGFDVADAYIADKVACGDLVITADIPLAAEVVAKGAVVLTPRGDLLDNTNIKERLSMRDFMDELRGSGVNTGGPSPLSHSDRMAFANQLDRWLARLPHPASR
ncbi:MAG: YaiI/YqxD family protein [Thiogranum sp.]|jgi:hypothetical protein|nr:YaiI/YqxD family protein [Thiogranum sp.]